MRIGMFTDCYLPTKNGVATSIVQLKEGLERRGHHVIILTVKTPHYDDNNPTVYRFPSIPFNASIEIRLGLVNQHAVNHIVQHERLELLHTHTEFSLGLAAKRAARRMQLPLIHTAHTMYAAYRHYLFGGRFISERMIQHWLAWFLRSYNALICPSNKVQQYLTPWLPVLKTVVIGNGVSPTRFNPERLTQVAQAQTRHALGINPSEKVILYVGRMAPEKRIFELLHLLLPLLERYPHYKTIFVGGGPAAQALRNVAQRSQVSQQVMFTGYIAWEQVYTFYGIAQVFVTASLSENHPMTLLEAAMYGLPIIARRDASYIDLVENGYNGYLADSDAQIAERISALLGDETALRTFSQNGRLMAARFTTEVQVIKCEALYRQVLNI